MLFSCCTIVVLIFESLGDEILNHGYEIDRGGGRGEEFLGIIGGGGGVYGSVLETLTLFQTKV